MKTGKGYSLKQQLQLLTYTMLQKRQRFHAFQILYEANNGVVSVFF
ncbi:DNA-binding protein YbaB [Thalassobacillus pellis]|nr:DNA-binding protein YbaB [Thalassobacillus pellis]